jgi:hypothetical protein
MKADFISIDKTNDVYSCDVCGKRVYEGFFINPETNKEWEILEKELGKEPEAVFVCERCLYEKFSPETKIYTHESRMFECEKNLRGEW